MVDYADFLFPTALSVTPTKLNRILFIGSCLTEHYIRALKTERPEVNSDFILFNNLGQFPAEPPRPIGEYDLQYVQIPLRSVLTDAVVEMPRLNDAAFAAELMDRAGTMLEMMLDKALTYNRQHGTLTLVSNFIVPQGHAAPSLTDHDTERDLVWLVKKLNEKLADVVRGFGNAYVADVEAIAATMGKITFLDDTISFYSHGSLMFPDWSGHENNPFWTQPEPGRIEMVPPMTDMFPVASEKFMKAVFAQIDYLYRIVSQVDQVKVVIFDLDNTLWRGQIGDHYVPGEPWPYSDGWPIGVWESVHHLRARGIMVAVSSKNDEALVRERWSNAVNPPFLSLDDFVSVQINWHAKAENIARILSDLSLTPKSAVFVDDNPVERAACMEALPGLRTIGSNPFQTRRLLLWAPETQVARLTVESSRRESMMRAQIDRKTQAKDLSREAFLQGLGTEVTLLAVEGETQNEYSRVVELINKTNQFNTSGKRWQNAELTGFLAQGGKIQAFKVKDRYADYGLVGVILINRTNIVQYVMSCRVLGMDIETVVLGQIVARLHETRPGATIVGTINETESNLPCRDLYTRAGFEMSSQPGIFLAKPDYRVPVFKHVTVKTEVTA
ncbi:hypothetical protein ABAC460_17010 [Asticcacaulis sp. AC460]|uniref:HAD-IIIC family phosphatase n=1 Tax=Asticcacaulis sp. AC460 TaxID=1282360 RepID=UPI0003C3D73F|nr:HAD-IIIC family phosphatase [Asticcacaulis sp. AC460]ESQ88360.1 hypothetical protein ABAC460_17010 [Asticcacaulis sp. AC460]